MFPQDVVIGPMPEPPEYQALLESARSVGDRDSLDMCYRAFVEGLGRELGTYRGVLDQAKYFGRAEEPATIKVSAVRTSGGRDPVGSPESRGWR
eukprot:4037228-Pyramimonas_sp.AAC.1